MAKKIFTGRYEFNPVDGIITVPGDISPDRLLIITNTETNEIIYNFAESSKGYSSANYNFDDDKTSIVLSYDTTSMSSTDKLQIFIEKDSQEITPAEDLIDPVGKMRVSNPENLIDTDFEYGLQATKWETLQTVNNIPTIYSSNGDAPLDGLKSVTAVGGSKSVEVKFVLPHGLSVGDPFFAQGLSQYQAEGAFVVSSVPDLQTFFFELDVPASFDGNISGGYTVITPGKFFEGSSLPITVEDGANTDGAAVSDILVNTQETHGFNTSTKVYLRNTVGPKILEIDDSTLVAPDGRPYVDTQATFTESTPIDMSADTGRLSDVLERAVNPYDWESTHTVYLTPSSVNATTDEITWNNHGLRNRYTLLFNTPYHGLTDGGLEDGYVYYVEVIDDNIIKLHPDSGLTSAVSLETLNNEYGLARLGLVYKVEEASGTTRFTAANRANVIEQFGFTQDDGGQIIDNPDGPSTITTDVNVTAVLGGNPTSVAIKQFLVAGDFNSSSEDITITIGNTTITSSNDDQSGNFSRMNNDTFSGFDVSPFLFTSGGQTFFQITHEIPSSVDDLSFFSPGAAARINMELETTDSSLGSIDKEYSGGDLYDSEFGLGLSEPSALVAFQGRTLTSYTSSADAFSYQINQRINGRYGSLSVKYNNVVTSTGSNGEFNGSFDIDFNDNSDNYGTTSEIFYVFANKLNSNNTIFIPDHGIAPGIIDVTANSTDFANGDRFSFGSSDGTVVDMPEFFNANVTVINKDIVRLTTQQAPNTDDIARVPKNFTLSRSVENPLFNSIFINNHKIRETVSSIYTNISGDIIPPLTNNSEVQLSRVNDSRLSVRTAGIGQFNSVSSTIGAANTSTQNFFIPCETELGFDPIGVLINSIEFRGDFGESFEFVDITFDDGSFYRIGQSDGNNGTVFTRSTTFDSKNMNQLLVTDGSGVKGFNVNVNPNETNLIFPPMSNSYELRFNYEGNSTVFTLEGPGSGSHEFNVNSLVGAYDGIFNISEINSPQSFTMRSDFRIPERSYEFDATIIANNTITFLLDHNLVTGEKIVYNNNGNTDIVDTTNGTEFFAIVTGDKTIKLAVSVSDALNNNVIGISSETGTHIFTSNSVIKNIRGTGTISTESNSNLIIGNNTSFLTNFKRFDKIYINNGEYVEEKIVDSITTPERMTIFGNSSTTVVNTPYYYATELSLRPDGYSLHLPFDGGVDITAGTSPDSKIIRQSRKYFRYQSGKGIQNSFAINFNPPKLVRELIRSDGSIATVITQEQHNFSAGDIVIISDATVDVGINTYNGEFTVESIIDEFTFTYNMLSSPQDVRAGGFPKFVRKSWTDSFVRGGMFDDQNGFFYEYDGQKLYAVRRSSTQQIAGTINARRASQVISGNGTSFNSQLNLNDMMVIRGQSYKIVEISSDERLVVQPAYRGIDADRVKITKTVDTRTPQEDWNIDPADGTGATGYNIDINKIQMAYIDYSWYGAGKIRYGFKDNDGHVRYFHEYKHNNRLVESYFRSGNLPGRYEVSNGSQSTTAPTLFHFGTSIMMDGRFDDDKAYQFNGQSKPFAFTNGSSSTITSNGDSIFERVTLTGQRVFVYSIPTDEATASQAVEGLQIRVDGSDELPNGTYVTQVRLDGDDSRIFTSYPATVNDPNPAGEPVTEYPTIISGAGLIIGEDTPIDLTRPIPLISVRLAPSVDSSITGGIGEREIINRMQLNLQQASVTSNAAIEVFLLQNATPSTIQFQKAPRPSLSEVIEHSAGDTLLSGTAIYSTKASEGSVTFSLEELLEIGNSILGGDGIFPEGPDLLTLAILPQNTSQISGSNPFFVNGSISWSESQA